MGRGLQHPSGRVIAVGRLLLATSFLVAIWFDTSQPARGAAAAYAVLAAYVAFAAAIVVATWNNWWLDAKLAGAAHAVDIVMFMVLVALTEGYTSPFFTFFMFVLLSAAIRWGWRATSLTAVLLTFLYVIAGYFVATGGGIEVQRFAVRTWHLVILSLILIWFGASQWRTRFHSREEGLLDHPSLSQSPFETGLRAAMDGVRARTGLFVWRATADREFASIAIRGGELSQFDVPKHLLAATLPKTPFLYDLASDRALRKDVNRNLIDFAPGEAVNPRAASEAGLGEGLAIAIRWGEGEGEMFLQPARGLSTDLIDFGEHVAADVAAHIQRHALLRAAEESAEARSRLTLARDLHDSVVQFLAGAAFRLEAMKRSQAAGRDVAPDLNELKQLMLQEQLELRSFITALRSGPVVAFGELAGDLRALAERLSRQWDVKCEFSQRPAEITIPTRLHLAAHQLMREAVANAVRHAEAKTIRITLAAVPDALRLEFINDGAVFPMHRDRLEMPTSLKERVDEAGGTIDIARGMDVTKVSISLPTRGSRQ